MYHSTYTRYASSTETEGGVEGGVGLGDWKSLFGGYEASAWDSERILGVDGGGGCAGCHGVTHLNIVKMINIMLCIFTTIKIKSNKQKKNRTKPTNNKTSLRPLLKPSFRAQLPGRVFLTLLGYLAWAGLPDQKPSVGNTPVSLGPRGPSAITEDNFLPFQRNDPLLSPPWLGATTLPLWWPGAPLGSQGQGGEQLHNPQEDFFH